MVAAARLALLPGAANAAPSSGVSATVQAGRTIVEPSGSDRVHIGQNRDDKPVVMEVPYVIPHGAPLSVDAPNPGCDFQEETTPHQP
ncbi:hypothetical protein AB0K12_37840 [Nonomuraea sp. NPDC049419]|uniref:hypothetical protein n=1 Tax=Nonomuraea sp. NPDC049419 TaxID=3155772 RepID=UPI0034238D1B